MKIPENVIGQPMSYKKLCQALDITPKSGKSKIYQLKDLALYCDIQHLSSHNHSLSHNPMQWQKNLHLRAL